jgi:uncharacterized RDD family membrane protein YckC
MATQTLATPAIAGFVRRLVALIVDSVLINVVAGVLTFLMSLAARVTLGDLAGQGGPWGTIQFLLGLLYFGFMWAGSGRTIGYVLMGIRVTRPDGGPIGVGRAMIRFALIQLSFGLFAIPAIVSALMILAGERKQGLHDLLVDTVVVEA